MTTLEIWAEKTRNGAIGLLNEAKSNWYIREPIYDSSVRTTKGYSGVILAGVCLSFVVVPMVVGILNLWV